MGQHLIGVGKWLLRLLEFNKRCHSLALRKPINLRFKLDIIRLAASLAVDQQQVVVVSFRFNTTTTATCCCDNNDNAITSTTVAPADQTVQVNLATCTHRLVVRPINRPYLWACLFVCFRKLTANNASKFAFKSAGPNGDGSSGGDR